MYWFESVTLSYFKTYYKAIRHCGIGAKTNRSKKQNREPRNCVCRRTYTHKMQSVAFPQKFPGNSMGKFISANPAGTINYPYGEGCILTPTSHHMQKFI